MLSPMHPLWAPKTAQLQPITQPRLSGPTRLDRRLGKPAFPKYPLSIVPWQLQRRATGMDAVLLLRQAPEKLREVSRRFCWELGGVLVSAFPSPFSYATNKASVSGVEDRGRFSLGRGGEGTGPDSPWPPARLGGPAEARPAPGC